MKNIVDYIDSLRMPVMITDKRKSVAYKNKALSSNRDFRVKRSLSSLNVEEGISDYKELCLSESARAYTFIDAFERKTSIAVYADKFCRWHFPISLKKQPVFKAKEFDDWGIPALFYEAEKAVVSDDGDKIKISNLFSNTANHLYEKCRKDEEYPLKSFASFFVMSAQMLFDDVNISIPDGINTAAVEKPSVAFSAAGLVIQTMYEKNIFDIELIYDEKCSYFKVGEERFDIGACLVSASVGAIAPYNYTKSDAVLAVGTSCCTELLFYRK